MKELIPLIPLRGLIIFPNMVLYFDVGREKSIQALEEAMLRDQLILLTTQKEIDVEDPSEDDFYHIGTVAKIKQMLKLPGDAIRVLVEGVDRAKVTKITDNKEFFEVEYDILDDLKSSKKEDIEKEAFVRAIKETFNKYSSVTNKIPPEVSFSINNITDPTRFSDVVAPQLGISLESKQKILESLSVIDRLQLIYKYLLEEIEIIEVENDITQRVKSQLNKMQKEYFLREQMKVIRQELGDDVDELDEIALFKDRLKKLRLKKDINEKVEKEINKLSRLNPSSPESAVTRSYIEWILDLPWRNLTKEEIDLKKARKILDEDHFGLDKVKERIIEYLAVRKLKGNLKGPIICLVGPPGVGKTSIVRSIARSVNRKFVRMSLGGMRDEAEIRGHRRTYVGAIPGRIITHLKECKSRNPLFLFDEIDKLANDFRGDPASALLEVLDPEQNKTFTDNYLEIPFDLSKVMFITTANSINTIPRPLYDRMEIIDISGYTLFEKVKIASRYLIPKQLDENGLLDYNITFDNKSLLLIIESYTRESGVRELERVISRVLRKVATILLENKRKTFKVTEKKVLELLGRKKYTIDSIAKEHQVGIVTGLAWTSVGGDTLQIEVNIMKGKGELKLTGSLGDIMKESAQAGLSYIRSISDELKIKPEFYKEHDIHIHVPEGAVPKDGPSAGITMAVAMISAITEKKVKRDVAMTGEITLRGNVLAIGGLKEKLLAAKRYKIKTILIPKSNEDLLDEVDDEIKEDLNIILVQNMKEVLKEALVK